jgi:hypothetical protein
VELDVLYFDSAADGMRGGNAAVWLLVVLGGVPVAEGARSLQAMARFMPFMGSSSGVSRPQGKGPSAEERSAAAERARVERELASFSRQETYSEDHEIADQADLDEWEEPDPVSVVRFPE